MAMSSSGGNVLDRDLDEIFSRLSSHLFEMERHFIRITEDYARLKNVFVASVAQAGISDTLMHEVQELFTVLQNNTQHFEIQ